MGKLLKLPNYDTDKNQGYQLGAKHGEYLLSKYLFASSNTLDINAFLVVEMLFQDVDWDLNQGVNEDSSYGK